jgi:hypothetical protein
MTPRRSTVATTLPFSVLLTLTALPGCGDDQDRAPAHDPLARVRSEEYRTWQRAPGFSSRASSNGPHADSVDIYVNDVLADVLTAGAPLERWPSGSTIVKDGYDGSELRIVAIMEKRTSGWHWAEYDSADTELSAGVPEVCIACHDSGSDYVLAFELP